VVTAGIGDVVGERTVDGVRTIRLHCRRERADRASLREMLSFVTVAWQRMPAIVRAIECDGVICFFSLPCGPVAWHTWKRTGVPYVISLRGGDVPGLVASIDRLHRILAPVRRAVLRNAISVIANSKGLQQLSCATDPVPVDSSPTASTRKRSSLQLRYARTTPSECWRLGVYRTRRTTRLQCACLQPSGRGYRNALNTTLLATDH